jgi:hypothetical protein
MITHSPETTTGTGGVAMITYLPGYRKDECSNCYEVLKRYDW